MNFYERIRVGDSFSVRRIITVDDVKTFDEVIGGEGLARRDEAYTRTSPEGRPVAHGALLLGVVSKVLGCDFPGHGSVAVSLSCRFTRPVPVGEEVLIDVTISEKVEKRKHVKVHVQVHLDGRAVLSGEGTVIPPSEPPPEVPSKEEASGRHKEVSIPMPAPAHA